MFHQTLIIGMETPLSCWYGVAMFMFMGFERHISSPLSKSYLEHSRKSVTNISTEGQRKMGG